MKTSIAAACAILAVANAARADPPRGEVGGGGAWAFPAGSFERGARVSDETYGVVSMNVDGAWRVLDRLSIGLFFQYGEVIPKLCASSSDCTSSLGRDVVLAAFARWHFSQVGLLRPSLAGSIGYEWFSSKLSDHGVASSRGHRGVLFGLDAFFGFALTQRATFGPTLGLALGVSDHASIDAPGVATSSPIDGHALHVWPRLGVRVEVSL